MRTRQLDEPEEKVEIAEAQRDVRQVYAGGSYGQVVSAVVWLAAAVVATVSSPTAAMLTLLLGGMLIFPAAMVGAHYLPFTFLYGMGLFAVLAGMLSFGGIALALWVDGPFSLGAWITGVLLLAFAVLLRRSARRGDVPEPAVAGVLRQARRALHRRDDVVRLAQRPL